ncbi:hypothetical protein CLV45_2274 [Hymenobacter chitinivorans DSM 11115]|uniref:Uncharacterized protein n=2 Tax=Hymenobacter chitinivorans TaxID=89969 RepID=A0A2M9BSA1_9BACT|nr:hypothetical protein CLV45_2274 [Hymenobacter chitinivorans DSM 11115]
MAAVLTGCENRKPVTTAETTAAAPTPPPSSVSIPAKPALATAREDAPDSASGDVAALHEPFEENKLVAPGLSIKIKSIPAAVNAIVKDPFDIKVTFAIIQNKQIIYQDTADAMTYDFSEESATQALYPLWMPTGQGSGELLVAFDNRPSKELARRFVIVKSQVVKIDTLPVFDAAAKDWDQDGKRELAGAMGYSETWDDPQGKARITYDPTLYYEVRPTGLVLDSALTKQKVRAEYGVFLGFKSSQTPGILISKLPKSSPKRQ